MTQITFTARHVEEMKADGHMHAAGALARSLGMSRNYGCHYGMRSTRDRDAAQFIAGWDCCNADRSAEQPRPVAQANRALAALAKEI